MAWKGITFERIAIAAKPCGAGIDVLVDPDAGLGDLRDAVSVLDGRMSARVALARTDHALIAGTDYALALLVARRFQPVFVDPVQRLSFGIAQFIFAVVAATSLSPA